MRSCLVQLLLVAAVVFALVWFGLPFGASWLATNAMGAAGFTGTNTKVEVSANMPPRILLGHADTIRLTASQVSVGDLHAATIDVSLSNVDLIDRTIGSVHGTLTSVLVPAPNGDPVTIDTVTIDGVGTSANATLTLANAAAESLAESQLKAQTGLAGKVKVAAPNKATLTINGKTQTGRLVVAAGELQLVPDSSALPTVILIDAGHGNPFQLSSVAVGASSVTLAGTIDLQVLLGL
jgi:hypothetical protein